MTDMDVTDLLTITFADDGRVLVGDVAMAVGDWQNGVGLRAVLPFDDPVALFEQAMGGILIVTEGGPEGALMPVFEQAGDEAMEPAFLEIPADIYRSKGFETTIGGSGFESGDVASNS